MSRANKTSCGVTNLSLKNMLVGKPGRITAFTYSPQQGNRDIRKRPASLGMYETFSQKLQDETSF